MLYSTQPTAFNAHCDSFLHTIIHHLNRMNQEDCTFAQKYDAMLRSVDKQPRLVSSLNQVALNKNGISDADLERELWKRLRRDLRGWDAEQLEYQDKNFLTLLRKSKEESVRDLVTRLFRYQECLNVSYPAHYIQTSIVPDWEKNCFEAVMRAIRESKDSTDPEMQTWNAIYMDYTSGRHTYTWDHVCNLAENGRSDLFFTGDVGNTPPGNGAPDASTVQAQRGTALRVFTGHREEPDLLACGRGIVDVFEIDTLHDDQWWRVWPRSAAVYLTPRVWGAE